MLLLPSAGPNGSGERRSSALIRERTEQRNCVIVGRGSQQTRRPNRICGAFSVCTERKQSPIYPILTVCVHNGAFCIPSRPTTIWSGCRWNIKRLRVNTLCLSAEEFTPRFI